MRQVVQQELPQKNLENILKTSGPSGAYLFAGIEGIGKRMMGTFFARMSNCLHPYGETGACGRCKICMIPLESIPAHPDISLIENINTPLVIDRLNLVAELGLNDEEQYFQACNYLYENNVIVAPVKKFSSGTPLDFFYRNLAMMENNSQKLMDLYTRIMSKPGVEPYVENAGKILKKYFLSETGGIYKDSIKLNHVKSLITQSMEMRPFQLKYKFYIIDEAHLMTDETQNSLLKILEEPPSHSIFILVSSVPHKLFPTILSRTNKVYFNPIPTKVIEEELVSSRGVTSDKAKVIAVYSEGSLGTALKMDEDVFFKERQVVIRSLEYLVKQSSYSWAYASRIFCEQDKKHSKERSKTLVNRLKFLYSLCRDRILIMLGVSEKRNHIDLDEKQFTHMFESLTYDQLVLILEWIENAMQGFNVNQDILLTIEELFIRINNGSKLTV